MAMEEIDGHLVKRVDIQFGGSLPATAGKIEVQQVGDGNSQETFIRVRGDQFCFTEFKKTPQGDGFELTIIGEWEISDFVNGLSSAIRQMHNARIKND
jgi:hypothetical protein